MFVQREDSHENAMLGEGCVGYCVGMDPEERLYEKSSEMP